MKRGGGADMVYMVVDAVLNDGLLRDSEFLMIDKLHVRMSHGYVETT